MSKFKWITHILLTLFVLFLFNQQVIANDLYEYPSHKKLFLPQSSETIVILNIWATWCTPCKKEMPMLSKWYKKQHNIQLIGIAIDNPDNIKSYLKHYPVSYPIWYFKGDTSEWLQSIGNKIGAVPFTLVSIPKCQFQEAIYGELTEKILNKAINKTTKKCKKLLNKNRLVK